MVFKKFLSKVKDTDILSSFPDGVFIVSSDGIIEMINETATGLLNMTKNELFKLNISELIENGMDLINQALKASKSVVGKIKGPNEKDLYIEMTAKSYEGYVIVSFRDVTQNYKTVTNIIVEHESSRKVNNDKNAFLVKLSNELKSPLHSIIGFSQAMVDGLGGKMSDKQDKYIKIINKNSNEMLYLLDKILELSKTESNLFDYDYQIFDIVNNIQAILKNYEPAVKIKSLNLTFEAEDAFKKAIYSDEGAFKVIFQNIMETSINSTDIGSINIKIYHPDLEFVSQHGLEVPEGATDKSFLMLTVTDTGAGVSENDLDVIFEPYAQLDRPNKKYIVRSIALASAKNLVKYLKGAIWIESEPMQGTTYNLILPIEKG